MAVRAAYLRTSSVCVWCGSMLMARVGNLRQRCPNDCASGLGAPPDDRLNKNPRGQALDPAGVVRCDLVKGELPARVVEPEPLQLLGPSVRVG